MKGGEVTNTSGIVFLLLQEMAEKLNFTYVVVQPKDGEFGVKVRNKKRGSGISKTEKYVVFFNVVRLRH